MNENINNPQSFDRMRTMLNRASEIRESEQQQIFDALDEIHARMSPLDSIGAMRKRLAELPDRTETSVLAERLDETIGKLETQDSAIASLARAVESIVDKLAKPFAQLDGRLDGVAARFEGVAGRMDGLEDKLEHIHKRIDELNSHLDKQDLKLDALPREVHTPVRERIEAAESKLTDRINDLDAQVRDRFATVEQNLSNTASSTKSAIDSANQAAKISLAETAEALQAKIDESAQTVHGKVDKSHLLLHGKIEETRDQLDPQERFDAVAGRLDSVTSSLAALDGRISEINDSLNVVESGLSGRLVELTDHVQSRPDSDSLTHLVTKMNSDSERRTAGQLDEAMATFAELILGGGPAQPQPTSTMPRQQRRARKPAVNGKKINGSEDLVDIDEL